MILNDDCIEKYCKIYAAKDYLIADLYFENSKLIAKDHLYNQTIDGVVLSDYVWGLIHFVLDTDAQNEAESHALFTLYILLSCFDIDTKFRVISKRKLIILMNMMYSAVEDQSDLFKKLLMTHGGSEEFIENSGLWFKNAVIYTFAQDEIDLNQLNQKYLQKNVLQLSCSTLHKIHRYVDQFLANFRAVKPHKQCIDSTESNEVMLSKIIKNQIDLQDLMHLYPEKTAALLVFALQHYRFGTWQTQHSSYMSLFYDTQQGSPLASILESDPVDIRFDCEYFIESLVLKLDTVAQAEMMLAKLHSEQNRMKFQMIIFKSGLAKQEIKMYFKVVVFNALGK